MEDNKTELGHASPAGGMAFDCSYLKETVGEALARGCAATVTAEPNDPVEYLGNWLLRSGALSRPALVILQAVLRAAFGGCRLRTPEPQCAQHRPPHTRGGGPETARMGLTTKRCVRLLRMEKAPFDGYHSCPLA